MWKSPSKTPATTVAVSQPQTSARSQHFISQPIPFPNIIQSNPQYNQLYQKIYKSQQKTYNIIIEQQQKQKISQIKSAITQKLLQVNKQKSFNKKFGRFIASAQNSARKIIKNQYFNNIVMATQKQQNSFKLNNFLMDHRKAVQLQQQARLTEYYLRDQQKNKSKIDYINKIQLTGKHRRTDPLLRDRQAKLFKQNNQMYYQLNRKTAYIRNDKLMSMSLAHAKNNPTYCRMKNFSQIQYILSQDNKNLMMTIQIPKDFQKQKLFNQQRRLFLSIAFASDSIRTYYDYIRQKQFNKVVNLLVPESQNQQTTTKVSAIFIKNIISKIIKYKQNKVIHFQDFIEILTTLNQQLNYNFIQRHHQKQLTNLSYAKKYQYQLDQFIKIHKHQISHILSSSKFEITAKKIYEINKNKIIARQYLPLREIVQLMKSINIVPKLVTMSKFMFICYWYQRRRQGFTIAQFVELMIATGLQVSGVGALSQLQGFFDKIDIKQLIGA